MENMVIRVPDQGVEELRFRWASFVKRPMRGLHSSTNGEYDGIFSIAHAFFDIDRPFRLEVLSSTLRVLGSRCRAPLGNPLHRHTIGAFLLAERGGNTYAWAPMFAGVLGVLLILASHDPTDDR